MWPVRAWLGGCPGQAGVTCARASALVAVKGWQARAGEWAGKERARFRAGKWARGQAGSQGARGSLASKGAKGKGM